MNKKKKHRGRSARPSSQAKARGKGRQQNSRSEKPGGKHRSPKSGRSSDNRPSRSSPRGSGKRYLGRVQKNPRGFAFVLPLDRTQDDAYVPREEALFLMPDDIVEYTVSRQGRRASAEILRIVERGKTEVMGRVEFSRSQPILVTGDNDVFILHDRKRLNEGDWVIGRIEKYPGRQHYGEASTIEWIGPELKPKYDYRIAIAQYGLENDFPRAAEEEAEDYDRATAEEVAAIQRRESDRRDLRSLPFVTIDGETAKDFDDAILVEKNVKGAAYVLYVAIADVSYFVRPGSHLDKSAKARATSVYFPGYCLPMLPEKLSNDLCSLRPKVDRLALNAEIHFDRQGNVVDSDFYASVIRTAGRLTYTLVHQHYAGETKELDYVAGPLKNAFELFTLLRKQRKDRGVLDFDLPEVQILVDDEGKPIKAQRADRFEAHMLIEEFMIAANRAVARVLKEEGVPALYRVHEKPQPTAVDELNQLMRNLGVNQRLSDATPQQMAKILDATAHLPIAKTLHTSILRLQKQARYEPYPKGHFGLALEDYAHFTSPIRRYPDLVVHRALKELIFGSDRSDNYRESEDLEELGTHTSNMERRAMEAERFVVKRKQCWFMKEKVGQIFQAAISGVIESGVFVEIPEFGTEGFVPMEQLGGFFVFDERRLCLRERPGHSTLSLGDPITVQLVRVSVEENKIEFIRLRQ